MSVDRSDRTKRESHPHPYVDLPESRFWRSGVAEADFARLVDLWAPKFPITRDTVIATVGSCFAQHVGAALKREGYNWLDSEPAPASLPRAEHEAEGYGVFSFRTGNIYTVALLLQWLRWAAGVEAVPDEAWYDGQRFHDPFRPRFPAAGYPSVAAMRDARQYTLQAIAAALPRTEVLVFTLGLTEAWRSRSGVVYPMCPGTLRGEFVPDQHVFHNYSYTEVVDDLGQVLELLNRFNPALRMLLTVSPVPLTATASGQHVLPATTYSKSVLRAAAGFLADHCAGVDYFPSYELIASAPAKGRYFAGNLRSVLPEGVDIVMGRLFSALGNASDMPVAAAPAAAAAGEFVPQAADGICDELVLDTWSRGRKRSASDEPARVILIGDSQMGVMAKVLDALEVSYAGGAIMESLQWHSYCFELTDDDRWFAPTVQPGAEIWARTAGQLRALCGRGVERNALVITNVGNHSVSVILSSDRLEAAFVRYLRTIYPQGTPQNFSVEVLRGYLAARRMRHMQLLQRLAQSGVPVVWVSDPPTATHQAEFMVAFDSIMRDFVSGTGCHVFPTREWLEREYGGMPRHFHSSEIDPVTNEPDWIHAAPDYYRALFLEILRRQAIPLESLRHRQRST